MRRSWNSRVKPLAGVLALVLAVTFTAPIYAAEAAAPGDNTPSRPLSTSVAKLSSMPVPAAAVTQDATAETDGGGKPFFKSNKGIAAIVLMVGGVAYTLHSKSKDRIKSAIR